MILQRFSDRAIDAGGPGTLLGFHLDQLDGQAGNDQLNGGAGFDVLKNFDNLTGSADNDFLFGDGDDNILTGGVMDTNDRAVVQLFVDYISNPANNQQLPLSVLIREAFTLAACSPSFQYF